MKIVRRGTRSKNQQLSRATCQSKLNENKGQIRFNFEGDEFCVDALGGGSFGPGGDIGLYKCKRNDKNAEWSHTSEQAITLRSKFDGQTLCMTNTGKYVRGGTACSSLSDEGRASSAAWNFIPPSSTPYPEQCPWTGVRQCMSDKDCNFFGAPKGNPCTKCHIGSGSTLNICGPP